MSLLSSVGWCQLRKVWLIVSLVHLADRRPAVTTAQMLAHLVPPPQFANASFDTYVPDAAHPSQSDAREAARGFFSSHGGGLFKKAIEQPLGLYLDGGFGVGKTHLLAAAWHIAQGRKYFGTFIEYTALVGALGYANAVEALTGADFIAIDEFELDDPGDTMLMTRLLGELMADGTRVMATSNTPPNALGEGRFAAADFVREIQGLSDRFRTFRIDGVDYRHRENEGAARVSTDAELESIEATDGLVVATDSFGDLEVVLAREHPSKYAILVDGVDVAVWWDVVQFDDQNDALRFVALVDRLYDADIPVRASGVPVDRVFPDDMLAGGFRKKYLRAQSRLVALTHRAISR
jgi:cell division protein ZapE